MSEIIPEPHINKGFPHSEEAEIAVLSCLMIYPELTGSMCSARRVTGAHFYSGAHQSIFNAMMALWERGAAVDLVTISNEIGHDAMNAVGGYEKLNIITGSPVSMPALKDYFDILHDKYLCREVWRACRDAGHEAADIHANGEKALAGILARLGAISAPVKQPPTMKELVMDKFKRMEANESDTTIIKTGLAKLDKISPLRLGSMPLVSGERKAGKSMLAMNIAVNIASNKGRVLYFTLEMPAPELVDRIYAKVAGIPTDRHTKDGMDENQYRKMEWAAKEIALMPMDIRDDLFDLSQITACIRHYKARHPDFCAAFIDYAQLIRVSLGRNVNREQEVAHVSRVLRLLSMDLKIAMVVLCQLNKEGETRESKALEQDCTAMWKLSSPKEDAPAERVVYVPFQRGGASNVGFKITYLGDLCRIFDYSGAEEEPA